MGRTAFMVAAVAGFAVAVGFALSVTSGRARSAVSRARLAPLVSIVTARAADMPLDFSVQGHIVALNQVEIRPQTSGVIARMGFREGDAIKVGQLLFTLEDGNSLTQLSRARAQAAQIEGQLGAAQRETRRARELVLAKFMSPSALDSVQSRVETLQAQLASARADIDSAALAQAYTRISAPMSAQAGAVSVHVGSLVQQGGAAPLVTLLQFDPVGAEFSLPEAQLQRVVAARAAGPVAVTAQTVDGEHVEGTLSFINNTVGVDSGAISLKAAFANRALRLWPGSFVRVTVHAGVSRAVVALPAQALREGPDGRFVYWLGPGERLATQPITLLRVVDGKAVVDGVRSGQRIVVDGASRDLQVGTTVRIVPTAEAQ